MYIVKRITQVSSYTCLTVYVITSCNSPYRVSHICLVLLTSFHYVNIHGFSTPISKILHFTTYHITFNDNYLLCKSRGDWVRIRIYGSSFSACAPGTWGKNCSDTCPDGFYGLFCENRCPCKKCNKVTGCGGTCNC